MSRDRGRRDDRELDDAVELRVVAAMAAFADPVASDPSAWDRIEARLEDEPPALLGTRRRYTSIRRPTLVAAAFVLFLVIAGVVVVQVRSTTGNLEMATVPGVDPVLGIVALTEDGRLVELGLDGTERRVIYTPAADGSDGRLTGKLTVSSTDNTVFVERVQPASCQQAAYAEVVGEIIAIPFAGGDPRVVVPVGRNPAYQPDGDLLAYAVPTDGQACVPGRPPRWTAGVVDLASGRSSMLGSSSTTPDAELGYSTVGLDPYVHEIEPVWGSSNRSLFLVLDGGSGVPYRSLVRAAVEPGNDPMVDGVVAVTEVDTGPPPIVVTDDGPAVFGSFSPVVAVGTAATPAGGDGADHLAVIRADQVDPFTVTFSTASVDDDALFLIDRDATTVVGLGPAGVASLGVTDTDVDPTSGNALITTVVRGVDAGLAERVAGTTVPVDGFPTNIWGEGGPPSPVVDPATDRAATTQPITTYTVANNWGTVPGLVMGQQSPLLVWDGSEVRLVATGIVAAAWVRVDPGAAPPSTTTTSAPSITIDGGSIPVTPSPGILTPQNATANPPDHVALDPATTDRPLDAAAIVAAFSAFFEHGDRAYLEGSEVLEPALQEGAQSVPAGGVGLTLTVTAVRFTGPDAAAVDFTLDKDGVSFTAATQGSAERIDGRWVVSAETMCTLVSRVGIACPVDG